ncbi:MAG: aldehyde dehydrogenase family protein [Chloroflexota bacterium]
MQLVETQEMNWSTMIEAYENTPIWGMYIDGKWVTAEDGGTFETKNPTTGSVLANIPDATQTDVEAAIAAAKAAQPAWEALPPGAKSALFMKVIALFQERQQEFVQALIQETGSGFGKAMFECSLTVPAMLEAAGLPTKAVGEIYPSHVPGKVNRIVRKPAGVVGALMPWNFPLYLSLRGFMYAVALGNTAVLKPSEDTPIAGGLMIAQLFADAGFPPGVINVVTTSRDRAPMVGDRFIKDKRINVVSFTGSTKVGQMISTGCASEFKPTMMELGGKNASIILDDADVDRAVDLTFLGSFIHQGQICMSTDKILVHRSIYDEFLQKLVGKTSHFVPMEPQEQMCVVGPIINTRQLRRIERVVNDAVAAGAKIEIGGKAEDPYYHPTILTGVTPEMEAWNEELFGPVTTVTPFDTEEAALAMANDTAYGLTGSIITGNALRGEMLAEQFEAGMIHVNDSTVHDDPHCPFSGHGASGAGGKWGPQGVIEAFTTQRWISTQRKPHPLPF